MRTLRRTADHIPVGARFGLLTVTGPYDRGLNANNDAFFPCRCDCGKEVFVRFRQLSGDVSCGHTRARITHGKSTTRLNKIWRSMRGRCFTSSSSGYENYGARGITVDSRWDDFEVFEKWMLDNGWESHLQIDRIDNNGDYSPENCRLATASENLRNTSRNRYIEAFGESKIMIEWTEDPRCAVSYATIDSRLRRGWDAETAITRPPGGRR